jgi:hypothetical protein
MRESRVAPKCPIAAGNTWAAIDWQVVTFYVPVQSP